MVGSPSDRSVACADAPGRTYRFNFRQTGKMALQALSIVGVIINTKPGTTRTLVIDGKAFTVEAARSASEETQRSAASQHTQGEKT